MMMTQEGLIDRIIDAMGLDVNHITSKWTQCIKAPISKDLDVDLYSESFAFASIVGMLLYMAGYSCPEIYYCMSQFERLTFCPKHYHKVGLKLIGPYLLATLNKKLIITPNHYLNIDAYPELYNYEYP